MKAIRRDAGEGRVVIEARADASDVDHALDLAQSRFCDQMGVPFEPGLTPAEAARRAFGIADLDQVVAAQALDILVPFAFDRLRLAPAFIPSPMPGELPRRGRPLVFILHAMLKPQFELSSYEPVKITLPPFPDLDRMVRDRLEDLREAHATYEEASATALERGMSARLTLRSTVNGEPDPAFSCEGEPFDVGDTGMGDAFDDALVGMSPGEARSVTLRLARHPLGAVQGPVAVDIEVTCDAVLTKVLPELTDELVARSFPLQGGVEGFARAYRAEIEDGVRYDYDEHCRSIAAAALAERFEGSIPDEVYEGCMPQAMQQLRAEVEHQGTSWERFVADMGGEQQASMTAMVRLRGMLVQEYALDAVYRREGLAVSEADLRDVCRSFNFGDPEGVRRSMEEWGQGFLLRETAERLCAAKWVLAHADARIDGASA
ncbi:hypothetical protein HLV37_04900 [Eggerthellaceae bacterium zg-1084]|uniref:trigger factor n=1 Tax=Berryella wangjianweii TaxID=2734634 RepID=UPI001557ABEE|nr:trigger factor [Berryella wangjianweii]NPD31201.1 hypothetical protein [Berryella wangjianweii]